jgi:vitamin B12 transporter
LIVAMILAICLAGSALGQAGASVEAHVTAMDGSTLQSAFVSLWPGSWQRDCDLHGYARLDGLPEGNYRLEVVADGFTAKDTSIVLRPGTELMLDFVLERIAETLPEVTVEGEANPSEGHVFRRKEIDASSAKTVPDFLITQAGVEVRSDGSIATSSVRIGGSSPDQVLVLVDGRRVQQSGSGEADLSSIPLAWVESIEVLRGGQTELGSEAIGGVIRIATRAPDGNRQIIADADFHSTYRVASVLRSGKDGPLASVISLVRTEGPGDFAYRITEEDGTGPFTVDLGKTVRRANADVTRDQVLLKVGTRMSSLGSAELSAGLDRTDRGMPGYLAPLLTPTARQRSQQESLNLNVHSRIATARLTSRASYEHDYRRFTDTDPYDPIHLSMETSNRWDAETQAEVSLARISILGGASLGREDLRTDQLAGGKAERSRAAAWSQISRPLWSSTLHNLSATGEAGARWEKFGNCGAILPKVALLAEYDRSLVSRLLISYGRSYRAPSFYSLFWLDDQTSRGNPDLRPETSSELTARGVVEMPSSFGTRLETEASDQKVTDLIVWQQTVNNRWQPFNLRRAHVRTLDLTLSQPLLGDHLKLTGGVNWTEARDATRDRNTGGKYLTFRAPRTERATASCRMMNIAFAATYRWVAARPALATNSKWLGSYRLLDVTASYALIAKQFRIEPSIGVNNLLDTNYRIVRFAPMPGREIFASLHITES